MAIKSKKEYNDKLAIWNIMSAADKKDYNFYDRLTNDQKKQFSPYLLMRWFSTVEGITDISKYYTIATNEYINSNFWDIQKHKKLQWLCICAASPSIGKQKHYWLGNAKRESSNSLRNILMECFPDSKSNDIDLMLRVNSKEEIKEWLKTQRGFDEKNLKNL
jgi:hypothetical protein